MTGKLTGSARYLSTGLIFLFVLGIALGCASLVNRLVFIRSAARAVGRVTFCREHASALGSNHLLIGIKFTLPKSGPVVITADIAPTTFFGNATYDTPTGAPYRVGDTVPVLYDPSDPSSALLDAKGILWDGPAMPFFVAGGIFLIAWLVLFSRRSPSVLGASGRHPSPKNLERLNKLLDSRLPEEHNSDEGG
jgi:hypothetical protein